MNPDDYILLDLSAGGGGPVPPWDPDDEDEEGGDETSPTPPADEEEAVFVPDPFARERALLARTGRCATVAEALAHARLPRVRSDAGVYRYSDTPVASDTSEVGE